MFDTAIPILRRTRYTISSQPRLIFSRIHSLVLPTSRIYSFVFFPAPPTVPGDPRYSTWGSTYYILWSTYYICDYTCYNSVWSATLLLLEFTTLPTTDSGPPTLVLHFPPRIVAHYMYYYYYYTSHHGW